jgi:hypothetical protein
MTKAILAAALAAIATASVVQAAPAPVVVNRPQLGVLNLVGAGARSSVAEDLKALAPLFGKAVEARNGAPPRCDVLLVYARLTDAGKVEHSELGIREIVRDSGATVAIVASANTADAYIAGTPRTGYGRANLVMTLDRKGKSFPSFFASLFKMMFAGTTMPVAWVQLTPQGPGQVHADAPETIFAAEAGQVAFSNAAPAPPAPAPLGSTERLRLKSVARTPALEGPDELERAPVVTLTPELVDLDGRAMEPGQLERELANRKKMYGVLHPKDLFNGSFVLACAPETPAARLREQLGGALAAGFPTVLFAFLREIPGTGWSTGSAVRALVAPPGRKARAAAGTVALAAHENCLELGRALVAARATQDVVRVELGEKAATPPH